jgi:uroporphyrinogen decarboxylase
MANEKFQNVLSGKGNACPPIWFMRQAGRYHSHYQALRKKHSFKELCKTPELAAEVAFGPVNDFDFDVSILFSDILFPLEALGLGLEYAPGPTFDRIVCHSNVDQLAEPEVAIKDLQFQAEAVKQTRARLPSHKSLIGFVGAPWTLFTYAVEGSHSGNMIVSKTSLDMVNPIFERLVPLLELNINMQLKAGAELVMLFDTSSGGLSLPLFEKIIMPSLERLTSKFPKQLGYYSKGVGSAQYDLVQTLPFAGCGYDHRFDLASVFRAGNKTQFVQGNFDQSLLFSDPESFEKHLDDYLKPIRQLDPDERKLWVSGLGHGVLPKTPEANVRRFVQRIREEFGEKPEGVD